LNDERTRLILSYASCATSGCFDNVVGQIRLQRFPLARWFRGKQILRTKNILV
jgi:hypothetical protein